ncbi:glycine cleavage system protein R [Terracoccus luteus]|uniref:Glycine cleavage system regulatory protein n=1 Tax=Terracoccus luteus TaxID=53356 RepID=A0A839PYH3_9MICO|nr:ACT domain-containing protein [Terracoccus luteus]MBB2988479.1 glycine cleavage system regulatory protein [Terracoccus luteus]MCP2174114.1 glycine cleavage system regulatory protein [Terracoccus luteus]
MPRLVLTVIGDDRAGLVSALASVVTDHGGNWEQSQLAELARKFAGIVVVGVPAERQADLTEALRGLDGTLDVSVHAGDEPDATDGSGGSGASEGGAATVEPEGGEPQRLTVDLLGNDRPGIVREVSSVLSEHHLSIESMTTGTREAPMAGGLLFEAHVVAVVPASSDTGALRDDLERLASELLVDIAVG